MSGGQDIPASEAFDTFGRELNGLADNIRKTGDLVGHMVADPGLYGILMGQIIGAAASAYCGETREAFNKYGESLEKHKEKLDKAVKAYRAQDEHARDEISRYKA
ncbi:hypothetical protein BS329_38955 [Amycolatopsis coloradensis]|uniref:ESX-1 secretion-associated protein n=1 Tax=Amycolatopsis coloradensis TaxID=76021 RepID=A0A1R0KEG8_9PSEU|nr:hypothetical protein [Amycolatopsis coloradensis]OLZ43508.1 hypothetical protein BS329_38955 [Amycolatopsis coloradensis]